MNNAEVAVALNLVCLKENLLPGCTNIKLHDKNATRSDITLTFLRELVERELDEKGQLVRFLKQQEQGLVRRWQNAETPENMSENINNELARLCTQHCQDVESRSITNSQDCTEEIFSCHDPRVDT